MMRQIASCEAQFAAPLCAYYAQFLTLWDGGEGVMGETYVRLWRVGELKEANDDYKVQEFIPRLMLIGSNGGGEAFGLDRRSPPCSYTLWSRLSREVLQWGRRHSARKKHSRSL